MHARTRAHTHARTHTHTHTHTHTPMLLMLPIMLVLCANMSNIDVKVLLLLEYLQYKNICSMKVFTIREYVSLELISTAKKHRSTYEFLILSLQFSAFRMFYLSVLNCLTLYNVFLYAPIVLLENIDLILAHYASIMLA